MFAASACSSVCQWPDSATASEITNCLPGAVQMATQFLTSLGTWYKHLCHTPKLVKNRVAIWTAPGRQFVISDAVAESGHWHTEEHADAANICSNSRSLYITCALYRQIMLHCFMFMFHLCAVLCISFQFMLSARKNIGNQQK
jgi:hypothetical protein